MARWKPPTGPQRARFATDHAGLLLQDFLPASTKAMEEAAQAYGEFLGYILGHEQADLEPVVELPEAYPDDGDPTVLQCGRCGIFQAPSAFRELGLGGGVVCSSCVVDLGGAASYDQEGLEHTTMGRGATIYRVKPCGDRWAVFGSGHGLALGTFDTRKEAEKWGRIRARREGAVLVIYDRRGKEADSTNYEGAT